MSYLAAIEQDQDQRAADEKELKKLRAEMKKLKKTVKRWEIALSYPLDFILHNCHADYSSGSSYDEARKAQREMQEFTK